MIPYWEETIRQSKLDISSCISHGLIESDYVPFEIYSFGTAIARLDEARFMIKSISEEIRILKKAIAVENKKYDLSNNKYGTIAT
jgi:hypothetical protein